MEKTIARMKHQNVKGYLKPIAFERWKMYVKMRKLLKFIMKNTENKLIPVKADLSIAFNKWRNDYHKNIV